MHGARGTVGRRGVVVAIGLAVVAVLTGALASAAPPKDAMVVGLLAEPVTMDPPQITDLNSARITKRIFEGLVAQELGQLQARAGPGPVVGHLARTGSPTRSSCGRTSSSTTARRSTPRR